jgi:hypothetical protein
MAKSSRSSVVKKNNQKLKKHVFGPIESARNERLNARLLELASQPKPARTGMEVERDGNSTPPQKSEHTPNDSVSAEGRDGTEAKDDQAGRSSSLSIPIPASLLHRNEQSQLPTPPQLRPTPRDISPVQLHDPEPNLRLPPTQTLQLREPNQTKRHADAMATIAASNGIEVFFYV